VRSQRTTMHHGMSFSGKLVRAAACLLAWSLVPALGCGGDDDDDHDDASDEDHDHDMAIGPASGATCPQGSTLSYESFGKAFMDTYCVRCHSTKLKTQTERMFAPEGHDFDVFEGIIGVAEHIDQYAASGPDKTNVMMPPSGAKPTMEEREQLGEWLACELDKLE